MKRVLHLSGEKRTGKKQSPKRRTTSKRKRPHKSKQFLLPRIPKYAPKRGERRKFKVFDYYGRHIAEQLRNIDEDQAIVLSKIINDCLYEAQCGNLSTSTRIFSPDKYGHCTSEPARSRLQDLVKGRIHANNNNVRQQSDDSWDSTFGQGGPRTDKNNDQGGPAAGGLNSNNNLRPHLQKGQHTTSCVITDFIQKNPF